MKIYCIYCARHIHDVDDYGYCNGYILTSIPSSALAANQISVEKDISISNSPLINSVVSILKCTCGKKIGKKFLSTGSLDYLQKFKECLVAIKKHDLKDIQDSKSWDTSVPPDFSFATPQGLPSKIEISQHRVSLEKVIDENKERMNVMTMKIIGIYKKMDPIYQSDNKQIIEKLYNSVYDYPSNLGLLGFPTLPQIPSLYSLFSP